MAHFHFHHRKKDRHRDTILPEPSQRLKEKFVWRLDTNREWKHRRLILSKEDLLVVLAEQDLIVERVPLHEIERVRKMENNELAMPVPSQGTSTAPNNHAVHNETSGVATPHCQSSIKSKASWRRTLRKTSSFLSFEKTEEPRTELIDFNIHTLLSGSGQGKTLTFRADTAWSCAEWVEALNEAVWVAKRHSSQISYFARLQEPFAVLTECARFQHFFALLIGFNFFINIVQNEILPEPGSRLDNVFQGLDIALTVIFVVELGLNLVAKWFWRILESYWLMFDFVVVMVSLVSLLDGEFPGVTVFRILRIFRVFRIFARLRSLRILINSLLASLRPVANALFVVILLTVTYAILGVQLFENVLPQYFHSFSLSMLTMFGVSTFDNISNVADLLESEAGQGGIVFLVSFVLIAGWTLLPVVVAVLLDHFVTATTHEMMAAIQQDAERRRDRQGVSLVEMKNPLAPVLDNIARFSDEILDDDVKGSVGFEEMREGLAKITYPPIVFTFDDWERMTRGFKLCNSRNRIEEGEFIAMLRSEMTFHIESVIAKSLEQTHFSSFENAVISALKIIMIRTNDRSWDAQSSHLNDANTKSALHYHDSSCNTPERRYSVPSADLPIRTSDVSKVVLKASQNAEQPVKSSRHAKLVAEVEHAISCIRTDVEFLRAQHARFYHIMEGLGINNDMLTLLRPEETKSLTERRSGQMQLSHPEEDQQQRHSELLIHKTSLSDSFHRLHGDKSGQRLLSGSYLSRIQAFKSMGIRLDFQPGRECPEAQSFKEQVLLDLSNANCVPRYDQIKVRKDDTSIELIFEDTKDKGPFLTRGSLLARSFVKLLQEQQIQQLPLLHHLQRWSIIRDQCKL